MDRSASRVVSMTAETKAQFNSALLSVLADPSRRSIFNLLLDGPKSVKVITADLSISQAAVSQHLKVMKEANLVRERKEGRSHIYSVNLVALEWLSWQFGTFRNAALNLPDEHSDEPVSQALLKWQYRLPEQDAVSFGNSLRLVLLSQRMQQLVQKDAEHYQLNVAHIQLLSVLDRKANQPQTITEISEAALTPFSTTVHQIQQLQSRALINSCKKDSSNESTFTITQAGQELLHSFFQTVRENSARAFYEMTPEQSQILSNLLSQLLRSL